MIKKFTLILLTVFSIVIKAQSIEVFAETDSSKYLVGDFINLTINLKYSPEVKIDFPNIAELVEGVEYINAETPQLSNVNDKTIEIRKFTFSKYDSAEVIIPAIPIKYTKGNDTTKFSINTDPIKILVTTLPVNAAGDIQDVKAPIKIQLDWIMIILIVLGVLIFLGVLYWIYVKFVRKEDSKSKIIKKIIEPPHKIALSALYELEGQKLWQQGLVKEYHSKITSIVRNYFEGRFNFLAMELTSGEIIEQMKSIKEAEIIIPITDKFLSNADLVKFAKFEPLPSVNDEMLKEAFEIVNKTKQDELMGELVSEVENV